MCPEMHIVKWPVFYHAKALPFERKISQLNVNWNIHLGTVGVQQFLERLVMCVELMVSSVSFAILIVG